MSVIYRSRLVSVPADAFGRPNLNPPTVVDVDNVTLYSFVLNTDKVTFKLPVPYDYRSGDFEFWVVWTNDGGADDDGRNVKWQLDYQTATEGDPVNGNHANSPKTVEDAYVGAVGHIEHHTDIMTIGSADFAGKLCVYLKLSAVTPTAPALTCDPHLIGVCFRYQVKINYI